MSVYIIEYLGDLHDRPMRAFGTFADALKHLSCEWGYYETNADGQSIRITPDPEDDRIVIWEAKPGKVCKAVWHFSGWHWDGDASDLPGGPLEQGGLLGSDESLYHLAMGDL